MLILIEHDDAGEIKFVAYTSGHGDAALRRLPSPGYSISEVEAEVEDERDIEGLRDIVRNYRVVGHPDEPRLARK